LIDNKRGNINSDYSSNCAAVPAAMSARRQYYCPVTCCHLGNGVKNRV